MNYLIRAIIAIVVFLIVMAAIPLIFSAIGLSIGGAIIQLIRLAGILMVLYYILWGPVIWTR